MKQRLFQRRQRTQSPLLFAEHSSVIGSLTEKSRSVLVVLLRHDSLLLTRYICTLHRYVLSPDALFLTAIWEACCVCVCVCVWGGGGGGDVGGGGVGEGCKLIRRVT